MSRGIRPGGTKVTPETSPSPRPRLLCWKPLFATGSANPTSETVPLAQALLGSARLGPAVAPPPRLEPRLRQHQGRRRLRYHRDPRPPVLSWAPSCSCPRKVRGRREGRGQGPAHPTVATPSVRAHPPDHAHGPANLPAVALCAAQLLIREAVKVGVATTEEPVACPADGTLRVGW